MPAKSETNAPATPLSLPAGGSLILGGALMLLVNVALSPLLPAEATHAQTAASTVFLIRQELSAMAAGLLLFGSVGIHLRQGAGAGRFGTLAFILAFAGSALVFAYEWSQVFLVHTFAVAAPEGLDALSAAEEPSLFDLGAMTAILVFTSGWILFAISMLRGGVFLRRGPILVIAGFFAIPLFGAALPGVWGQALGTVILGSGLALIGYELARAPRAAGPGKPQATD